MTFSLQNVFVVHLRPVIQLGDVSIVTALFRLRGAVTPTVINIGQIAELSALDHKDHEQEHDQDKPS